MKQRKEALPLFFAYKSKGESMHKGMLNFFSKNKDFEDNNQKRNYYGFISSLIGIVSNFTLFLIKYILGMISFSIAIKADAFNNLFDSLSSLIALIGFKLSDKPADLEHPFGHARFELISDLLVGLVISSFGFIFAYSSISKLSGNNELKFSLITIVLLVFTTLVKLWQGSFYKFVARDIDSSLLMTTASDSYNDVLINITILLAILCQYIFKIQVDGLLGLILSIYIIITAVSSVFDAIKDLLGRQISYAELLEMEKLLLTFDDILGYHDLMVHNYGPTSIFATVHIEVDSKVNLLEAHGFAEKIEDTFLNDLNVNLVVHIDPVILDDPLIGDYVIKLKEVLYEYNSNYTYHDFRLINHDDYNIIYFDLVIYNDKKDDKIIVSEIKKLLHKYYSKDKINITIDRNYLELGRLDEENK